MESLYDRNAIIVNSALRFGIGTLTIVIVFVELPISSSPNILAKLKRNTSFFYVVTFNYFVILIIHSIIVI